MDKERAIRIFKQIKIILIVMAIIGALIHLYLMYDAASKLDILNKSIDGIDYDGGTRYRIRFTITFENPTSSSIEVSAITYKVYIESTYAGYGKRCGLTIPPGNSKRDFEFIFDVKDMPSLGLAVIGKTILEVDIKGEVTIPVKAFGFIDYTTISVPYNIKEEVNISKDGGGW